MVLINGLVHGLSKSILKTPHREINNIKKKLGFKNRFRIDSYRVLELEGQIKMEDVCF